METKPKDIETINVKILCSSSSEHLSQIFTGFGILNSKGYIKGEIIKGDPFQPGPNSIARLRVILEDNIKIVFDTFDGSEINKVDFEWCDFYFKRSFLEYEVDPNKRNKILPLGFNYPIYGPGDFGSKRIIWNIESINSIKKVTPAIISVIRISGLLSFLANRSSGRHICFYRNFEDIPRPDLPPRIIFLTRMWDPGTQKSYELRTEREIINEMRSGCIRKLRNEFGSLFVGGVDSTEFAKKYFSDLIIDPRVVLKRNYLPLLKTIPICISTMGLLGSNGWKLAEYIAGSKAIVSEPLKYRVPGDFQTDKNFLSFTNPEECVEKVSVLVKSPLSRAQMMKENYAYYHSYLRPDILVWNTLMIALKLAM